MLTSLKELNLRVDTVIEKVPHLGRVWGIGATQDFLHGFQALFLQLQHRLPQHAALLLVTFDDSTCPLVGLVQLMSAVWFLLEPRLLFGRVVVPKTGGLCFGDKFYIINKDERLEYGPGRIWGPSEVVNARRAPILRQDRHYTGCGEERVRVYADSTGFVP